MVLDGAALEAEAAGDARDRMPFQSEHHNLLLSMGEARKPAVVLPTRSVDGGYFHLITQAARSDTEVGCQGRPDNEPAVGKRCLRTAGCGQVCQRFREP